jgi:carbonic anhydrase/acetyltransferase-like protein (isoleucine patch superfamily)
MAVYALGDIEPRIHPDAFVHPDAVIIGNVEIGAFSSIWPGAVLRGDMGLISIGSQTSIQDCTVIHCIPTQPTSVGDRCVVGHIVHLEGCTIQSDSLVGNGSVVLHFAVIESHSLVGSNAVIPNNMVVPSFSMALGVPAKLREHTVAEGFNALAVQSYVDNGQRYKRELRRIG